MKKNILLMYSTHTPSAPHISKLKSIGASFEIEIANSEADAIRVAKNSEIVFGHRYLRQILPFASSLKWVQTTAGGIDRLPLEQLKGLDVLLTRTTVCAKIVARHAYTLAWALIRGLPQCFYLKKQERQKADITLLPMPTTALVLGFGHIGRELAKLLRRDGIRVWGSKREIDKNSKRICDELLDSSSWREVLPQMDLCFLCLPSNKSTKNIFDKNALCALPKHAVVVNVGRSNTLDVKALFGLLREGKLGGAGLDVADVRQLTHQDLFSVSARLIITPYIAAHYPRRSQHIEKYFESQLMRYLSNNYLKNIVEWKIAKTDYSIGDFRRYETAES